jgi:hypothetical protein
MRRLTMDIKIDSLIPFDSSSYKTSTTIVKKTLFII